MALSEKLASETFDIKGRNGHQFVKDHLGNGKSGIVLTDEDYKKILEQANRACRFVEELKFINAFEGLGLTLHDIEHNEKKNCCIF